MDKLSHYYFDTAWTINAMEPMSISEQDKDTTCRRAVKLTGLHRKKGNQIIKPSVKTQAKPKKWLLEPPVVPEVGWPGHDNSALLHSNMKRSFRYRKITLRQEKPLFVSKQDGANSSDEEGENENGGADMTIHEEHVTNVCPNIAVEPSTTSGIDMRYVLSRAHKPQ